MNNNIMAPLIAFIFWKVATSKQINMCDRKQDSPVSINTLKIIHLLLWLSDRPAA